MCEVGFGPGVLLRLLCWRFPDARLHGGDPSGVMLGQARRRFASSRTGRGADLRLGAVGRLPFDDAAFHVTVAVNTVAFGSDLGAGLSEIACATRPQGEVMVAWHGGQSAVAHPTTPCPR